MLSAYSGNSSSAGQLLEVEGTFIVELAIGKVNSHCSNQLPFLNIKYEFLSACGSTSRTFTVRMSR